jgi:hypothetical protein
MTPQTVQSFMDHQRPSWKVRVLTLVTLVTVDCTLFDIEMSVIGGGDGVYSPPVLRLRMWTSARAALHRDLTQSTLLVGRLAQTAASDDWHRRRVRA